MKKWILILTILFLPLALYAALDKNANDNLVVNKVQAASGKPSVIKFYADMCLDCTKQKSIFDQVKPKYSSVVEFIDYNAQSNSSDVKRLIKKYNITVVPTTIFLDKNNNVVRKIEGLIPEETLDAYILEIK